MIFASTYGFAPNNTAEANSAALQRAADQGGEILVDGRGIAAISEPVVLGDDVTLRFENGLYLRREPCKGENGYVLVNKGAFTGEENRHIRIEGMRLICNGVENERPAAQTDKLVPGLNGMLSFYHVRDLEIRDFEMLDLGPQVFGIHICSFENVLIENVRIEGRKDAVHLGRGRRFVIRHGIFRTFDDPIALNAHDYSSSNPALGWIEDGLIEDCYDLNDKDTTGFFCRILAGSWLDWFSGMKVQNSDTVVYNHRLYRVFMEPDGKEYTSLTPPSHEHGTAEYDGICWVMVQEGDEHNCGCRNIHFKDIFLEKNRPIAFAIHFDKDPYSRSVYPNSEMPVQSDIIFENIYMNANVPVFLFAKTPVNNVRVIHSVFDHSAIFLKDVMTEGESYERTNIILEGCTFKGSGTQPFVKIEGERPARISAFGSSVEGKNYVPLVPEGVEIGENDIGLTV